MWKRAWKDAMPAIGIHNWRNAIRSTIVVVIALLIVRYFGGQRQMSEELRWILSTIVALGGIFIFIFLIKLIKAPVHIRYEKEKEAKLTVEEIVKSNDGKGGYSWGLIVSNRGTNKADDCRGELVDIAFAYPQKGQSLSRWIKNQPLQWEQEPIGTINTSISGLSRAVLQFANRNFTRGQLGKGELHISYAISENLRETHALPISTYIGGNDYIFVISLTSRDRLPIYAVCFIASRSALQLTGAMLIGVVGERPTFEDWSEMLIAHKVEIENLSALSVYS